MGDARMNQGYPGDATLPPVTAPMHPYPMPMNMGYPPCGDNPYMQMPQQMPHPGQLPDTSRPPQFAMTMPPPFALANIPPPPPPPMMAMASGPPGQNAMGAPEMWPPMPPRPSLRVDIRILISKRDYDAIMARTGSNLQRLCGDKAVVQMPDSIGPERILTTFGDIDSCARAVDGIFPALIESNQYPLHACDIRLLVHQSHAGAIIGRKGDRVKELRQLYQVDIKVFPECCPRSSERVVRVRGRPDSIVACIKDVYAALLSVTAKGQVQFYDPANFNEGAKEQYGGYSFAEIGLSTFPLSVPSMELLTLKRKIDQMEDSNRSHSNDQKSESRVGTSKETKSGDDASRQENKGEDSSKDPVDPAKKSHVEDENADENIINRVTVPPQLVPVIMGPGGSKLEEIKRNSNCEIVIGGSVAKTGDSIITIKGTSKNIRNAQFLLQTAVRQSGMWKD